MPIVIRQSADPLSERSFGTGADAVVIVAQSDASRVLGQELERYCREQTQGRSFLIAGHRGAGKTTTVADVVLRVIKQCNTEQGLLRPLPVFLHGPSLFTPDGSKSLTWDIEGQAEIALQQVMLGLHRATVREFVRAYRHHVLTPPPALLERGTDSPMFRRWVAERSELAAQFEIEILEDPPASRLREFWDHADALTKGVLNAPRVRDGGSRELVALNGVCNAHQRISGNLSGDDKQSLAATSGTEAAGGFDLKAVDALKPIAALLSSAVVGAGTVVGTQSLWKGALLGGLVAVASSFFMKRTTTATTKRERTVDTVFIPDLSVRTLDRILPTLLERLRDAGLAPVFVIDELDKIQCLSDRIVAMVHYLKKLFAETVFTCFLTDRGYLEYLRVHGRHSAYSVAYSYFSFPLLIAYEPLDIDRYLSELLTVEDESQAARLDLEVFKWVLRHRSQMHALDLARELMSARGEDGQITIPEGLVRTAPLYKLDVTFQVAIEFALTAAQVIGWKAQRPVMRQTLLDALYYISRVWLRGDECIDLSTTGESAFTDYLRERMNLKEVTGTAAVKPEEPLDPPTPQAPVTLTEEDMVLLTGVARDLARFLCDTLDSSVIEAAWPRVQAQSLGGLPAPRPEQSVLDNLLLGDKSALYRKPADPERRYRFRYWPSGTLRVPSDQAPVVPVVEPLRSAVTVSQQAQPTIDSLRDLEASAWQILRRPGDPEVANGAVYVLLSEETRVLPTTPAWSQVALAIQRLEAARLDVGSTSELEADLLVVTQFRLMLTARWPALAPLWVVSAFLGGVRADLPLPESVRFGLVLMSAALDFAAMRADVVNSRVEEIRTELEKLTQLTLPIDALDRTISMFSSDALLRFNDARIAGLAYANAADWPGLEAAAWRDLENRINRAESTEPSLEIDAASLLCAAASLGPGAVLPLSQRPVTLRDCTRLLDAALHTTVLPNGSTKQYEVPITVVAYALRRLGAGSLTRGVLLPLTEAVMKARGKSSEDRRLNELLRTDPHRRTERVVPQVAIVIAQSGQSSTLPWTTTPTRGIVLVLLEGATDSSLVRLAKLFESSPVLTLVWEGLSSDEVMRNLSNVSQALPRNARAVATGDPESQSLAGSPKLELIAAPDGADQLLMALASAALGM